MKSFDTIAKEMADSYNKSEITMFESDFTLPSREAVIDI